MSEKQRKRQKKLFDLIKERRIYR